MGQHLAPPPCSVKVRERKETMSHLVQTEATLNKSIFNGNV